MHMNISLIIAVLTLLLTVLEEDDFQRKHSEAAVPVGYRTSHYKKKENKMNPATRNQRYLTKRLK